MNNPKVYECFVSESVVLTSRYQIAIAGAKKPRGVSLTPFMKPCMKAFAHLMKPCTKLFIIIHPPILSPMEKPVRAVMFFRCHPVQGRRQKFKLVKYQIKKMFHFGVPFFLLPTFLFCTLSESVQLKCSMGLRQ